MSADIPAYVKAHTTGRWAETMSQNESAPAYAAWAARREAATASRERERPAGRRRAVGRLRVL